MKKIITLFFAGMLMLMVSASARQPIVILKAPANYEVRIDGRNYTDATGTSTISTLTPGVHTLGVYQVTSGGIFGIGKKRTLISTQQFTLGNNDLTIDVNQNGQARVYNSGSQDNNTGIYDNNNNGKYGKSEGKGRGHKYGHYKNKKNKKNNGNNKNQ